MQSAGERIFTRTVRQVKQQTTVHYFVSPPRTAC
ncbi:hypothetical protein KZ779_22585 [Escherichia coli]|nr:hypothetical protein [Escherichia coli]